ncbi:MAG: HEAT repeat domain-containing protein [Promethearchaeota archaeon]
MNINDIQKLKKKMEERKNPSLYKKIVQALKEENSDIRLEAISIINEFYPSIFPNNKYFDEFYNLIINFVSKESQPIIKAVGIKVLGKFSKEAANKEILTHIISPNTEVQAAIFEAIKISQEKWSPYGKSLNDSIEYLIRNKIKINPNNLDLLIIAAKLFPKELFGIIWDNYKPYKYKINELIKSVPGFDLTSYFIQFLQKNSKEFHQKKPPHYSLAIFAFRQAKKVEFGIISAYANELEEISESMLSEEYFLQLNYFNQLLNWYNQANPNLRIGGTSIPFLIQQGISKLIVGIKTDDIIEILNSALKESKIEPLLSELKNRKYSDEKNLNSFLNSPNSKVRSLAINLLGEINKTQTYERIHPKGDSFKKLLPGLQSPDYSEFKSTLDALIKIDKARSVEVFLDFLNNPPPIKDIHYKSLDVIDKIGNLEDDRIVDMLIKLLDNNSSSIAARAALSLGKIGNPKMITPVLEKLKSNDERVRESSIKALAGFKDDNIIDVFITLLEKNLSVEKVLDNLDKIDWKPRNIEEKVLYLLHTKRLEELKKIGREAVDVLINLLRNENQQIRKIAAEALGYIGDKRALEPLIGASKDVFGDVREVSVHALGELGDKGALDRLNETAIYDFDESVRIGAIEAMGKLGEVKSISAFVGFLNESSKDIRISAANILGILHKNGTVIPFSKTDILTKINWRFQHTDQNISSDCSRHNDFSSNNDKEPYTWLKDIPW